MGKAVSSYQVTVGQWDLASDGNYALKTLQNRGRALSKDEATTINNDTPAIRDKLFSDLFNRSLNNCSILLLRGAEKGIDHKRAERWLGEDYHGIGDGYGSFLAWKKNQFSLISYEGFGKEKGALTAVLKDLSTETTLRVASCVLSEWLGDEEADVSGYKDEGDRLERVLDHLTFNAKPDLAILGINHPLSELNDDKEPLGHNTITEKQFVRITSEEEKNTKFERNFSEAIYGKSPHKMQIIPVIVDGLSSSPTKDMNNPSNSSPLVRSFVISASKATREEKIPRAIQAIQDYIGRVFQILEKMFFWNSTPSSDKKKLLLGEMEEMNSIINIDDLPPELILESFISYFEKSQNKKREGIFRINGDKSLIERQYPLLIKGKLDWSELDVSDAVVMMKKWVREQEFFPTVDSVVSEEKSKLFNLIIDYLGKLYLDGNRSGNVLKNLSETIVKDFFCDSPNRNKRLDIQYSRKMSAIQDMIISASGKQLQVET